MRVDESWRSNESESCDSHPLSSSFDQVFDVHDIIDSKRSSLSEYKNDYLKMNSRLRNTHIEI